LKEQMRAINDNGKYNHPHLNPLPAYAKDSV